MGVKLGQPVRQGIVIATTPDLTVRIDNDGAIYRATTNLPPGTVVAGAPCTVASFGTALRVIAVHGVTVPATIEAGHTPTGTAPPQGSVLFTLGVWVAEFDVDHHTIPIADGIFPNAMISANLNAWSTGDMVTTTIKDLTQTAIDFYAHDGGTASTSPIKVSYTAWGW